PALRVRSSLAVGRVVIAARVCRCSGFLAASSRGVPAVVLSAIGVAQRLRLDRACHDLNRLLDEPGP
ncbi:MAG: hypothetical protein WA056_15410, partial [Gallionella sp.]